RSPRPAGLSGCATTSAISCSRAIASSVGTANCGVPKKRRRKRTDCKCDNHPRGVDPTLRRPDVRVQPPLLHLCFPEAGVVVTDAQPSPDVDAGAGRAGDVAADAPAAARARLPPRQTAALSRRLLPPAPLLRRRLRLRLGDGPR